VTFEGLLDSYYVQAKGLVEGGADLLLVETCQDTRISRRRFWRSRNCRGKLGRQFPSSSR